MKIHVGNLPHATTDAELREVFMPHGAVSRIKLQRDEVTGLPRGIGLVEMPAQEEAEAAISALDGRDFGGSTLRVREARLRGSRPSGAVGTPPASLRD